MVTSGEGIRLKLTVIACFVLLVAGAAYGQEPVNHTVSQPNVLQGSVSQPTLLQVTAEQHTVVVQPEVQEHAPVQPFVFQPMVNIPHQRPQPEVVLQNPKQPVVPAITIPSVPDVHQSSACGCSSKH